MVKIMTEVTRLNESRKNTHSILTSLVDIRDVKIDKGLPSEERIRSYVQQIKNPYQFKVGDVIVKVSFSGKENTISDNFINMIANM